MSLITTDQIQSIIFELKSENVNLQKQIKQQNDFFKDEIKKNFDELKAMKIQKIEVKKMQLDYVTRNYHKMEELAIKLEKMNSNITDIIAKQSEHDAILKPIKENSDMIPDQFKRMKNILHPIRIEVEKMSSGNVKVEESSSASETAPSSFDLSLIQQMKDDIEILTNFVRPLKFEVDKLPSNFEKMQKSIQSTNEIIQRIPSKIEEQNQSLILLKPIPQTICDILRILTPQESLLSDIKKNMDYPTQLVEKINMKFDLFNSDFKLLVDAPKEKLGLFDSLPKEGVDAPYFKGIYSLKKMSYIYDGPILCVVKERTDEEQKKEWISNDKWETSNFYADIHGNIGTEFDGKGISINDWLSGRNGIIKIWFDQSGRKADLNFDIYRKSALIDLMKNKINLRDSKYFSFGDKVFSDQGFSFSLNFSNSTDTTIFGHEYCENNWRNNKFVNVDERINIKAKENRKIILDYSDKIKNEIDSIFKDENIFTFEKSREQEFYFFNHYLMYKRGVKIPKNKIETINDPISCSYDQFYIGCNIELKNLFFSNTVWSDNTRKIIESA